MSHLLTRDQLTKVLPSRFKGNVSDELINDINTAMEDPGLRENYRDNLLGLTTVLLESNSWKLSSYIEACKYASFKMLGNTNIDAYIKTFPDRYQRMLDEGMAEKDIASMASAYRRGKLVVKVIEQTLMPSWIINIDNYQKAVNVLTELMITAKSEKVRADSAASLLTHLKRPETHKLELDVGVKDSDAMTALIQKTSELAELQLRTIQAGTLSVQDIAKAPLIIESTAEQATDH
jgi:hypothetical protein